jgi:hypothetical protein
VNEAGSYRCGQCDEGFRPPPDNPLTCEDVDECDTVNNDCTAFYEALRPCARRLIAPQSFKLQQL